jgi:hypothetical protein
MINFYPMQIKEKKVTILVTWQKGGRNQASRTVTIETFYMNNRCNLFGMKLQPLQKNITF